MPIADFYYSETFKDGGWGKCKHYKYKVHFVVINNTDDDTHDTELLIDEKDKYVLSKKMILIFMCLMGSIIFCILNLDIKKQKEILK